MTVAPSSLETAARTAFELLATGWKASPPPAAVDVRRVVFGLAVLAVARSRSRGPNGTHLASAIRDLRLPGAERDALPGGTTLQQAFATISGAALESTPEQIIAAYERSLAWVPGGNLDAAMGLDANAQHAAGAFFTPPDVAERLLDQALDPTLQAATEQGPSAVRALRICDPACGPGIFILAALRRVARQLARLTGSAPSDAASEVVRSCVYGVDLDLAAVELCRGLAWLETALPWSELSSLRTFRCANSLLGATPALADTMLAQQGSLFAPQRAPSDRASDWCRQFVDQPAASFFHWHTELPEVFCEARGPRDARTGAPGGFDVVVGNPPFLNQLEEESAHGKDIRALLRARFSDATRGYADTAVTFMLLGVELLRTGGRCTLIAPLSVLGARDADAARQLLAQSTVLESIWIATERVFEGASVFVCAPSLRVGGSPLVSVSRQRDRAFTAVDPIEVDMTALAAAPTWSPLVSDILGIPSVRVRSQRTVSDEAAVTADFRDQYYGLRGFLVEDCSEYASSIGAYPPLVTTGLVDLAACHWGAQPTRFDGQRWKAPRVDLLRLERDGKIGPWARGRLVPKLLVATQTRVLEVVVDERGEWIPSIPLISAVPNDRARLWHLAAALSSPPLTAIAAGTYLGTALSVDSIKLSANQVRGLPLPIECPAWDAAAEAFRDAQCDSAGREGHIVVCGRSMCVAYGLDEEASERVLAWWLPRALGAGAPDGQRP